MLRAVRAASREFHRIPYAENYHDIVFSQQRHQAAQDRVGILLVECLADG
jgi:hypothetical protein